MREESFWAEAGAEIEEYLKTLLPPGGNMKSWGHELKKIADDVVVVYGSILANLEYDYTLVCRWNEETGLELCHSSFGVRQSEALAHEYRTLLERVSLDEMTQVYNRHHMELLVNASLQNMDGRAAFIMLDIDGFKQINDRFGHVYGDECLIRFARALWNYYEETGYVGRMGGDEFCIFIEDAPDREQLKEHCLGFQEYLRQETAEGLDYQVDCSIGICFSDGCSSFLELYRNADKALYQAKRNKMSIVVFENQE